MRNTMVMALVLMAPVAGAAAPPPETRSVSMLTSAGARAVLDAAERLSLAAKDPAAIAVVDTDGVLLAFERMDGVRPGSGDLAIGKARSAALMQRPTSELEDNVRNGRVGLATAGLTPLRGGAPLRAGPDVVGAVGIAGTKKEDDEASANETAAGFGRK